MGLILHPDSCCDVCLCEFVADDSSKNPHAIACGHIFCRDCLYTLSPPICPMCRRQYLPNKMKRLHVGVPEEIDDRKEIDLLQRLVLSWDTPQDQLKQIVDEVDAWLETRSEEACISLRKARTTLERHKAIKNSEAELRNIIPWYEDEKQRLEVEIYQAKEQAAMQIQIHEETHRTQLRELTKELAMWKMKYKNEPRPTPAPGYGSYGATRNPLPPPPEPISTEQIPTFEQVVSQSGAGMRYAELPPTESTRYRIEGGSRSHRHRRQQEERYSTYPSQVPASSSSLSNHYVQPHVSSPAHDYRSPHAVDPHQPLQVQFHPGRPLDVFGLTSDLIHEYGFGHAQGQRAAMRNRYDTVVVPPLYPDTTSTRPAQYAGAYIEEAPESSSLFAAPPQAASSSVSSGRRQPRRRSTLQSSIVSSSPSRDHDREVERRPESRSRSRSRSRGHTPSAASSHSTRSHPGVAVETQVPAVVPEAAPPRSNPSQSVGGRASSPASLMSGHSALTHNSWGTQISSAWTEGSLIDGLRVPRLAGSEYTDSRRHSSISEMSSLGLALDDDVARDASPVRPVMEMAGVLPQDDPNMSSSSEAETVRQQSREQHGRHRSTTALDQRDYHADAYRNEHSSTARIPESHDSGRRHGLSREDRAERASASSYRSPPAVDPRSYSSDYHEAPPPAMSHRDSDHSYSRAHRPGQLLRASNALPAESPGFPVSVEYTAEEDTDYFRRRDVPPHSSSADSTSFTGNALGLELSSAGINAPAPIVPTSSMMRSWSDHNRN